MTLDDYCRKKLKLLRYNDTIIINHKKAKEKLFIFRTLVRFDNEKESYEYLKYNKEYFDAYYELYQYLYSDIEYYIWYKEYYSKNYSKKLRFKNPTRVKEIIFTRDKHQCVFCNTSNNLTIDHIYPLALFHDKSYYNLMTLCLSCNHSKRARIISGTFIKDVLVPLIQERNNINP